MREDWYLDERDYKDRLDAETWADDDDQDDDYPYLTREEMDLP